MGKLRNSPKKAIKSLLLLVNWEIWKERNARTLDRREASTLALLGKIKEEARAWGNHGSQTPGEFRWWIVAGLSRPLYSFCSCVFCLI